MSISTSNIIPKSYEKDVIVIKISRKYKVFQENIKYTDYYSTIFFTEVFWAHSFEMIRPGSMIEDPSDHVASKEPMNPGPEQIHRLL